MALSHIFQEHKMMHDSRGTAGTVEVNDVLEFLS